MVTCLVCGTIKRFPAKRGYQLWYDKPEALLEQPTASTKDSGTSKGGTGKGSSTSKDGTGKGSGTAKDGTTSSAGSSQEA